MKKSIILSCLMAFSIANCSDNSAVSNRAYGMLYYGVAASYLLSIKYFKLGFNERTEPYELNILLASINSAALVAVISDISGLESMKHPIFAKFCVAIGGIGTIAHFSYLINKKRLKVEYSKQLFEKLIKISSEQKDKLRQTEDEERCSICLGCYKDLISENKDVFQSPCCGGITCKKEMNKWIDSNVKIIDGKLTCPCCGRNLVEFIKKSASC